MSSDAIVVLKADHKEIRNLFRKFQAAGDKAVKKKETLRRADHRTAHGTHLYRE